MTPEFVIIHCSDSPQGRGDDAKTIHKWHKQRGYDGIGYNYVVLENGEVQNGRPEYWEGAHARGFNDKSIGICMIGTDSFTDKQIFKTLSLVRDIMVRHSIPKEKVLGHCETDLANGKTCPNYPMDEFRGKLNVS